MQTILVTPALRREVQRFYRLDRPVTVAEVRAEYANLARLGVDGIVGSFEREALRDVFVRHGADPIVWREV